jgi:hypothetical protein
MLYLYLSNLIFSKHDWAVDDDKYTDSETQKFTDICYTGVFYTDTPLSYQVMVRMNTKSLCKYSYSTVVIYYDVNNFTLYMYPPLQVQSADKMQLLFLSPSVDSMIQG